MDIENKYKEKNSQSFFQKIRKNKIVKSISICTATLQMLYPSLASAKVKSEALKQEYLNSAKILNFKKADLQKVYLPILEHKKLENHTISGIDKTDISLKENRDEKKQIHFSETKTTSRTETKIEPKTIYYPERSVSLKNQTLFTSDILSGVISSYSDLAYDNVFNINIARDLHSNEDLYLEYDLYGVSDSKSVIRSINDEPSSGGYLIEKYNNWSKQKEKLSKEQLVKGINHVKFNSPENADITYRVKNVRIISETKQNNQILTINQAHAFKKEGKIYLSGTVNQPESKFIELNNKKYPIHKGAFEIVAPDTSSSDKLTLKVLGSSTIHKEEIKIAKSGENSRFVKSEIEYLPKISKFFQKENVGMLNLDKASIKIDAGSLKKNISIFLSALNEREVMPVPLEMVNVTDTYKAFRFLPHGEHFSNPAQISISYDPKKIPQGYTPYDIQTYYFDNTQKKWLALQKDSVDVVNHLILSKTNHFTDFINGVIQVPESPETGNLAPTSMSDIKAADPSTGVVSIAAPAPNQQGTVSTHFPIKLPAGRSGMEPSLAINYSSEGGNSWLGLGWNLSTPAISIDTRWGVPRYDPEKESEIYSLGGEQLTFKNESGNYVMPHREGGNNITRTDNRQFFPRIEGSYSKIERKGNSPKNYYWVVTSKNGTKSYYGGDPQENSVLKDATGNIGYWAIWKVIDANNNYIEYIYDKPIYNGSPGNGGQEFYLKEIQYTKHQTKEPAGIYKVIFNADNETRKDVQINAKLGFVQVTSKLLNSIEVKYKDTPIRKYELKYTEGAFFKTLLSSISEYDADGKLFYTNTLEYEDHVRKNGTYVPFGEPIQWNVPDDKSIGNSFVGVKDFTGNYSVISGTKSSTKGFNFGVSVGAAKNALSFKRKTIGAHGGSGSGKSETRITLIDIDGDGLPDKVYNKNGSIYYRKNLSASGVYKFDDTERPVSGISTLGKSSSSSWNAGVSGNYDSSKIALGVGLGYDISNTTSIVNSYFKDFNGDGLVDFVNNGKVYFNHLDENGHPVFEASSGSTPSPINGGGFIAPEQDDEDLKEIAEMEKQNPLHDVVRTWAAPADGSINVEHNYGLKFIPCEEGDDCSNADGVEFSFQVGNNSPLWKEKISQEDFTPRSKTNKSIAVKKGQKLYFRISSVYDGKNDLVTWNPVITYTNIPESTDANNQPLHQYNAAEDFVVSSESPTVIPENGSLQIKIGGTLLPVSDEVKIKVLYDNETSISTLAEKTYPSMESAQNLDLTASVSQVKNMQKIFIQVETQTNIHWPNVNISPDITLTTESGEIKKLPAEVSFIMYNHQEGVPYIIMPSAQDVGKYLYFSPNIPDNPQYAGNEFTISAKQNGMLVSKKTYIIKNYGILMLTSDNTTPAPISNSPIYLELTSPSTDINFINFIKNNLQVNGSYVEAKVKGQVAVYNETAIITGEHSVSGTVQTTAQVTYVFEISNLNNNTNNAQLTINGTTYIVDSITSLKTFTLPKGSFTYTLKYIGKVKNEKSFSTFYIKAPEEIYNVKINNINYPITDKNFGLLYRGWGGFIVHGDKVNKETGGKIDESLLKMSTDYTTAPDLDENTPQPEPGSGFSLSDEYFLPLQPIFSKGVWQGTDPDNYIGKTESRVSRLGEDNLKQFVSAPSPGSVAAKGLAVFSTKSKTKSHSIAASVSGTNGWAPDVSGSGGLSKTISVETKTTSTMVDMNGDGFPDHIYKTQTQFSDALGSPSNQTFNYGNSFQIAKSDAYGASGGGSFTHGSTSNTFGIRMGNKDAVKNAKTSIEAAEKGANNLGLSGNINQEKDHTEVAFIDVNGDGLPDKIENGKVKLNLGYGIYKEENWSLPAISKGLTNSFSLGLGYSFARGSFSGGINYSKSDNEIKEELIDLNGDGLADYVVYKNGSTEIIFNPGNGFNKPTQVNYPLLAKDMRNTISTGMGGSVNVSAEAYILLVRLVFNTGVSTSTGASRTYSSFEDIDGDGYLDFITSDDQNNLTVRLSNIGTTNLLKKVTTPMGGSWEVSYKRVGNTYEMPQSRYVMETLTVNDGFSADNQFSPDETKLSVDYGKGNYSRRERDFYGFDSLTINELDVLHNNKIFRYTQKVFKNNNYFEQGQLLSETLFDASHKKWRESRNEYKILKRKETSPANVQTLPAEEKNLINFSYFVPLVKTKNFFYEGSSENKATYTEIQQFDIYGNVTRFYEQGEGKTDALISEMAYTTENTASYIVGQAKSVQVKNSSGTVLRHRESSIDPVTGNLKQIKIYNGNSTGEFSPAKTQVYDFEYDVFGNLTQSTRPENYKKQRFWTTYQYDSQVHTYPVFIKNALGYYSSIDETDYDFRFGVPLFTVDMNNQPMRTVIDAKGRPITITGPNELFIEGSGEPGDLGEGKNWTISFDYPEKLVAGAASYADGKMPAGGWFAITRHYDYQNPENPDGINTITISDGLGKPVQVKKLTAVYSGENNGKISNTNQYVLSEKVVTDAFRRALKTYYPAAEKFSALPADPKNGNNTPDNSPAVKYNPANDDPADPTLVTYDVLDRALTSKLPGEDLFSTISYGFREGLFLTTMTDELNHKKETYTDIKGRTLKVKEYSTNGDITTRFEFDPLGSLLKVTDVDNNETLSTYDNTGVRISVNHPDAGLTKLQYDNAGNLISRNTANGHDISYSYTYNRLDKIIYPENDQNNVYYYYGQMQDGSAMDNNAVGRIWYQTDASGTQFFTYGRMGELVYNRRSVVLPGDPENKLPDPSKVFWFQTAWEYDSWNRVKNITYPDGEKVFYNYNNAGDLYSVTSKKGNFTDTYIDGIGYDKFGQRVVLKHGNGNKTNYEYETQRRRLLKMKVSTAGGNKGRLLLNNTYQYDVMSNIRLIDNAAEVPAAGLIGGPSRHEFGYDDLNRLTTASGSWKGYSDPVSNFIKRDRYTLTMAYDQMHNITRKALRVESNPLETGGKWEEDENRTYSLEYLNYNTGSKVKQPHAPRKIIERPLTPDCCDEDPDIKQKLYNFDNNGNQTMIRQYICKENDPETGKELIDTLRINIWDEENRLRAVDMSPDDKRVHYMQLNTYDAAGERIVKNIERGQYVQLSNGVTAVSYTHDYQLYPSGMLVVTPVYDTITKKWNVGYTKHYYAGTQRIVSKIGTSPDLGSFLCDWLIMGQSNGSGGMNERKEAENRQLKSTEAFAKVFKTLKKPFPSPAPGGYYDGTCISEISTGDFEKYNFYYHPDHLGSTSYITDRSGEITQHEEYIPFGESFVSEHRRNQYNSPFKFNGKEFDAETGLFYYGARYYNPRESVWLSVDPLAGYNPIFETEHYIDGQHNGGVYNSGNNNPYIYTYQNPVIYVDPNGKQAKVTGSKIKSVLLIEKTVVWEGQAQMYRVQKVGESTVSRIEGKNWSGSTEYKYTVFPKEGGEREYFKGASSSGDFAKSYPNHYDYDQLQADYNAYDSMDNAYSLGGDAGTAGSLIKGSIGKVADRILLPAKMANATQTYITAKQINDKKKMQEVKRGVLKDTGMFILGGILDKVKDGVGKIFGLVESGIDKTKPNKDEK